MSETPKRDRRSSQMVRDLIVSAARKLFTERGYRASTKDIAELADVSETIIFRKFGSKSRLFDIVITEALIELYENFDKKEKRTSDPATRGEPWISDLFSLFSNNRELMIAYLSAREFEPDVLDAKSELHDFFGITESRLDAAYKRTGDKPSLSSPLVARITFAAVLGVVLHRNWIFQDRYADRDLVKGLTKFVAPHFGPIAPPVPAPKAKKPVTGKR